MPSLASLPSLGAWWQASRPLAQANLALPLLLGQALAVGAGARFDPWLALLVHAFGLALHLFIVFSNDYADRDIDVAGTRTLVSGGSGVLVEGKLRPRALARAARAMAAA
ncbi:MAG: prenyltransferase, partial [Myxococcales bacterium]|nr:prenyltransferase [Myxococcales bacterium]